MGWSDQVENDVSQLRYRINWITAFVTRSLIGKRVKVAYIMSVFKPDKLRCKDAYRRIRASDVNATVKKIHIEEGQVLVEFEYDGETLTAWVNLEEITPIEEEGK